MATMITDPLLLQQAAAGNKEAYNTLFATHYYRLYDFMLRTERMSQVVVEDICQNIFLRLWAKKEVFLTIDCLEAYLRTAGHNAACDYRKKEKSRQRLNNNYRAYCEVVEQHTGDRVIYKEGRMLADKVIAALLPREKLIFTRYTEEELPFGEIGKEVGLSASRTKFLYYNTKAKIKKELGDKDVLVFTFLSLCYDLLQSV